MTDFATITADAHDPLPGLLASLQLEFDGAADARMARDVIMFEAVDFHWAARVESERIGPFEALEEGAEPVDIWSMLGMLAGCWFVARVAIDEAGRPRDLLEVRRFDSAWDAYEAYDQ